MTRTEFTFQHRRVCVYATADANAPTVYSIDYEENGEALLSECQKIGCQSFNLVTISALHWDEELSPWVAGQIVTKADHFTGEADTLLRVLTTEIIATVEQQMQWRPSLRVLAGYSMSGLFALYAMYNTNAFSAIVSASGSLWFPNVLSYAENHLPNPNVHRAYFSLGDRESKTKHRYLKTTEHNTQTIAQLLQSQGVETIFEMNEGNHFTAQTFRVAKGVCWVLR